MYQRTLTTITIFALSCATAGPLDRTRDRVNELLVRFHAGETTDRATQELLVLGKADPSARKILAENLPPIIAEGPRGGKVWRNALGLAGALKLGETVNALIAWIDFVDSSFLVLGIDPVQNPAAWALAQIGDPAVPALASVLAAPDNQIRGAPDFRKGISIMTLQQIRTPAARDALREALLRQTDARLKHEIQQALTIMAQYPLAQPADAH